MDSEETCVRECAIGENCNGQALEGDLYDSFEECCRNHLSMLDNSPCPKCLETYWEDYFWSQSASERGFHPVCKSIPKVVFTLCRLHYQIFIDAANLLLLHIQLTTKTLCKWCDE